MSKETIDEFYTVHGREYPHADLFNVYRREEFACDSTSLPPNRRDFYKISMITEGAGLVSYADRSIQIDRPAITFLNPLIPYGWEPVSKQQAGYFCLFKEDFLRSDFKRENLSQSPLFKVGGNHVLFLEEDSQLFFKNIFDLMLREVNSMYPNKYDLLQNYIQIIIHEGMKMQPPETFYKPSNSSERITTLFLELLERQFPVDTPTQVIRFKTANEFATQLNVHTNTLNRALKEATEKTTTEWIAERLIKEAKALLKFSSWDIAEIAYCLGFEHASNFIIFFKKQTDSTPLQFRRK